MHEIGGNYDHCLTIVKGNQGHPGRAARIRARRDREDLRPRVRFRGSAQVRVGNPLEITPIRKRETELNPRRGSARLRANRFAPLQTVDRPKPGKLRDQDGRQAGCVRKHVLPSRFLIGLSRASDETRRKGLLNPSTPQLLRGCLARRGRLTRRPPRRRPSALAPLGPATGGASPPGEPSRIAPRTWAVFPGAQPRTTRRRDDTTTGSLPARLWNEGDDFSSSRQPVVSSSSRSAETLLARSSRRDCGRSRSGRAAVPGGRWSPSLLGGRRDDKTTGVAPARLRAEPATKDPHSAICGLFDD